MTSSFCDLAECNDQILGALSRSDVDEVERLIRAREALIHRVAHERIDPGKNLPLLRRLREQGEQIEDSLRSRAEELEKALEAANALRTASSSYIQASSGGRPILSDGLRA